MGNFMSRAQENTMELTLEQKNQLRIDSIGVTQGTQTGTIKCPCCGEDKSFSVKRDGGGLLYKCFRAKCGVEGYVPTALAAAVHKANDELEKANKFKPNKFLGDLQKLTRKARKFLLSSYGITGEETRKYGFRYNLVSDRLYLPIYNLWGMETGAVLKKLPESEYTGPKTVNHWEVEDPLRLHFTPTSITDRATIVVVEDILSSSKVSTILPSCALLGSSMSMRQAAFLATHFRKMVVLLDPDAIAAASKICRKFGGMFDNGVVVRTMDKDPKDIPYTELETMLRRIPAK